MSTFNLDMTTQQLLQVVADHHHKRIALSDGDRQELVALLKKRGQDELDYGQEMEIDSVRLVKRVTGAVGLYFS